MKGGAMARVPAEATAFAYRDSEVMIVMPVFVPPAATDTETEAALEGWYKIAPFGKGAYTNFFTHHTDKEVAAAYPEATLERLATIKNSTTQTISLTRTTTSSQPPRSHSDLFRSRHVLLAIQ